MKWGDQMKTTGIVKKIDQLGRVVVPREIRRSLMLEESDPVEMYLENGAVIIKPYKPNCIICGGADDIVLYKTKKICSDCVEGLTLKNA